MTITEGAHAAGREAPISRDEEDRYGFKTVADGLAGSILGLTGEGGTVIGIEGKWGAGKTSLLNLLLTRLEDTHAPGTHVLRFSPWLSTPGSSPVDSLLLPVADILRREEEAREPAPETLRQRILFSCKQTWRKLRRKRNSGAALEVLTYIQQTSGRLAPVADFAGNFLPGLGIVSKGMDALAKVDLSARRRTSADLRASIESQLNALGLTFIVIIDDLDRLEPAQAVEVLRLVRSVADFSRFRYVMCYDRDVLAHAVEQALGVHSGRLYLQKIIPLSFSLPRPESFTLSRQFCLESLALYREINSNEPDADIIAGVDKVTRIYGEALTTPREVSQAISAIRFRYPSQRDYVWFPDVCLLQLVRVINPALYDWIEHYLSERAIVATGDAVMDAEEEQNMSVSLGESLAQFTTYAARSAWQLSDWLPGIYGGGKGEAKAFGPESQRTEEQSRALRRLGSPVYWRYYFAFSAPGNVLSEAEINEIIQLASDDPAGLAKRLLESLTSNGVSSLTWYEHIITRLKPVISSGIGPAAEMGLLKFFFNHADSVMSYFRERSIFFGDYETGTTALAKQLIRELVIVDRQRYLVFMCDLVSTGQATLWSAALIRSLLYHHGVAGAHPAQEADWYLTSDELEQIRQAAEARIQHDDSRERLLGDTILAEYLFAWRDIAGEAAIKPWLTQATLQDETFLRLLLTLQTAVSSSDRGVFLMLDLTRVTDILGEGVDPATRLRDIEAKGEPSLAPLVKEVTEAVRRSRHY